MAIIYLYNYYLHNYTPVSNKKNVRDLPIKIY